VPFKIGSNTKCQVVFLENGKEMQSHFPENMGKAITGDQCPAPKYE
jgi:hypothetical protein